jgi:hypothetical protein
MSSGQLRMKLRLVARKQHNLKAALLTLSQLWASHLYRDSTSPCVLHRHSTFASNLNAVMKVRVSGQTVGAKAGARIIHLKQLNRRAGPILDRNRYVMRTAA